MREWLCCIGTLSLLSLAAGCSTSRYGFHGTRVDDQLLARTTHVVDCVPPCSFVLPPDVVLEDGVSEDEAIATALSNNSAFQATLSLLDMARGDVIQAGLLTNPNLLTFLPVSVKQWEWTLYAPIEAFVLRPRRVGVAQSDYERVANQLVQNGLILVRDVRVAHADLGLALQRWQLSNEAIGIRRGIATLTQRRLERGEISELESIAARIDASKAEAAAALLEQDVGIASSRLAMLMGLPPDEDVLGTPLVKPPSLPDLDVKALITEALASRPDVQAAQWAVDAASAAPAAGQVAILPY